MDILFEDYYLLVINKPAGLSTENGHSRHPSAENEALFYVTEALNKTSTSKRLKATPFLRAAHRLDRGASGVLVFAKTKTALSQLMQQFETRQVVKTYLAWAQPAPPEPVGELLHFLKRDIGTLKALVFDTPTRDATAVELTYKTLQKKGAAALLEIQPATGRYHQIRAQLAHVGCPIVGDVLYGARLWQANMIKLHAHRLRLSHPKTGAPLELEAPLPTNW